MKVLVTGAGGQLGRVLLRQLGAAGVGATRAELAVEDVVAIARVLGAVKPDVVVNAAAYTHVDRAETEAEACFRVNRDGAANVAKACAARGIRLVHISTDYVFDGTRERWREDDPTGPCNVYGASKLAGEKAVLADDPGALVVRTSWVFSAVGRNFVVAILRLAASQPVLKIIADQHGCPTHADDLARALIELAGRRDVTGVLHYCGDPATTWHGFAEAIVRGAGLAERVRVDPITSHELQTPAWRPRSSILDTSRARALGLTPAAWRDGLDATLQALR